MKANKSHYKIYKTLAHLHRTEPALTQGNYQSFTTNNNTVLGIVRNNGYRIALLLINFSDNQPQTVDVSNLGLPSWIMPKVASLNAEVNTRYNLSSEFIFLHCFYISN